MSYLETRRTVLKAVAALRASGLLLPPSAFSAEGRLLVAETRTIEVLGRAATVFGLAATTTTDIPRAWRRGWDRHHSRHQSTGDAKAMPFGRSPTGTVAMTSCLSTEMTETLSSAMLVTNAKAPSADTETP